jgi:hypothetical protein
VPQHPELLIQYHGSPAGGRVELPHEGRCQIKDESEAGEPDGEQAAMHRPQP